MLIPNNRENPPSPNVRLSKGYRIADIKASAHASHKTYACISLKQRGYSHNYGLVCNLGKQMAVSTDLVDQASGFANGRRRFKASSEYPNSLATSLLCSPILGRSR